MFDKPVSSACLGGEVVIDDLQYKDSVCFDYDDFKEHIGVHLVDSNVHVEKIIEYMDEDKPDVIETTVKDSVMVDVHQIDMLIEMLTRIKTIVEVVVSEIDTREV